MPDTIMGGIIINEILVDPNGAANYDTDGNGTAASVDEYIELYNTSGAPIDISGVQLWDQGVGNWFTFPPGTILQPGGHAMVMSGVQSGGSLPTGGPNDLFFNAGRASPLINNGGDNVVVYDPGSDEYLIARFNGDPLDNPPASYAGFSATATLAGVGEDFGNDIDGFSIQRQGDGANTFVNNQGPTPGTAKVCLTLGTCVATPKGEMPVETLRVGDLVLTLDHGPQRIEWLHTQWRPAEQVSQNPKHGAVRIARGAMGPCLPRRSLMVSRQHRMLVRSEIAMRIFGNAEVLVHAKDLIGLPGITAAPVWSGFMFFHLLLAKHEVIFVDGAATESLFLGRGTINALPRAARRELQSLPAVQTLHRTVGAARTLAKGPKVRALLDRHRRHRRPLCQPARAAA